VPPEVPPARRGPGPQPRLLNTVPTELPRLLPSRGRVPRGACGMLAVGFARSYPRARRAGATRRGSARGPEPRAGSPRRGGSRQDLPASAPVGRRGGMPDRPGGGCRVRDGARIRGPACAVRADARASRASAESAARRVEHGVRPERRAAPGSLPRRAGAERSIGVASGAPKGVSAHAALRCRGSVVRARRSRPNPDRGARATDAPAPDRDLQPHQRPGHRRARPRGRRRRAPGDTRRPVDLSLIGKQLHWSVVGRDFRSLHL
jgi:hypothetical protein